MNCEVSLFKAGQVFKEKVVARDYEDARKVALARNPGATVIGVTAVFKQIMGIELKDWLNSINQSKKNIINEDPSTEKEYPPYIINKCLSGSIDCLMFVNEMNMHHSLQKKLQYDFLINTIRSKKRFNPWIRREKIKDLECVKSYYGYSNEKAEQSLRILSDEQLKFIKSKLDIGGTR